MTGKPEVKNLVALSLSGEKYNYTAQLGPYKI